MGSLTSEQIFLDEQNHVKIANVVGLQAIKSNDKNFKENLAKIFDADMVKIVHLAKELG